MRTLLWIIVVVALVLLILGGTVKAVGFLLWVAPVLLVVAVLLFIVNRSGNLRIPS